jgi:fructokinase
VVPAVRVVADARPTTIMKPMIAVMGETLCDLFANVAGTSLQGADAFVPHVGGAPANVAVQLARLGCDTRLVSAVGKDPLGDRLLESLARERIDTRTIWRKAERTGLTLVDVDSDGERRFFGWRNQAADEALTVDDINNSMAIIGRPSIGHIGTVTLRSEGVLRATTVFMDAVQAHGARLSVDVNLRPGMWPDVDSMLLRARAVLGRVDIVKASDDEARLLLDQPHVDADALVDGLLAMGPSLVMLTLAKEGAIIATQTHRLRRAPPIVKVIDATGAGDAFVGGALSVLLGSSSTPLSMVSEEILAAMITLGNQCGAACTTAMGATTAMPVGDVHG